MLEKTAKTTFEAIDETIKETSLHLKNAQVSRVESINASVAQVSGLRDVKMDELLLFDKGIMGMAQTLGEETVGVVFLNDPSELKAGDKVSRTERVVDVPVGEGLLGRVINPLGQPLDEKGSLNYTEKRPIEREAFPIMSRAPVSAPLQTGLKAIDSFTPIGRGQRELILGDRQTGKTAIALDTIINQKDSGVISIYCAIGQRIGATARVIEDLKKYGVMDRTIVVVSSGEDEPGMQFIAPYAATSIGEYFMEQGQDVLIVYDDLTNHARAYRQMSLLLRRPPGREAFPGDIFYIHSRLLERSTHLRKEFGGGSLTALPIVSTEAGNISAYIPTNIISITDGQIYLSASLFNKGIMPAIDTGRSVSRVGGDAQLPAYSSLIGPLKLFYSQFEELESFARFGTQLDKETEKRLLRGQAIRLVLQQVQFRPMEVTEQIAVLFATNEGFFDGLDEKQVKEAEQVVARQMKEDLRGVRDEILEGAKLTDEIKKQMRAVFSEKLKQAGLMKNDD